MDTEQFKEHASRYLHMYLPTSGFCILADTRYQGDRVDGRTVGGKIHVTRTWRKDDKITALQGKGSLRIPACLACLRRVQSATVRGRDLLSSRVRALLSYDCHCPASVYADAVSITPCSMPCMLVL